MDKKTSVFQEELIDPFVATKGSFLIRAEHYMRYAWVRNYLSSQKVIYDIACGNGYGSKILASVAKNVIGFDKSSNFIEEAQNINALENIRFITFDLEKNNLSRCVNEQGLPKPSAIVCFETLEHISNPQEVLESFYTLLPKNGILAISVPNAMLEPKKNGKSKNVFHKQLFTKEDIINMLSNAGFTIKEIKGQAFSNIILHKAKWLVSYIDVLSRSDILFQFLAWAVASPTHFFKDLSYSYIFVTKK